MGTRSAVYLLVAFALGWLGSTLFHKAPAPEVVQTPSIAPGPATSVTSFIDQSRLQINERKYSDAIATCEKGLAIATDNKLLRNNLGVARLLNGNVGTAVEILTRLTTEAPDFKLAANNLKWALSVRHETEQTIAASKKALASAHNDAARIAALWPMAQSFAKLEDHEGARAAYEQLSKLDPKNAAPLNNLGVELMALGRPAEALEKFQSAVKLDANQRLYANNVRWAQSAVKKS